MNAEDFKREKIDEFNQYPGWPNSDLWLHAVLDAAIEFGKQESASVVEMYKNDWGNGRKEGYAQGHKDGVEHGKKQYDDSQYYEGLKKGAAEKAQEFGDVRFIEGKKEGAKEVLERVEARYNAPSNSNPYAGPMMSLEDIIEDELKKL